MKKHFVSYIFLLIAINNIAGAEAVYGPRNVQPFTNVNDSRSGEIEPEVIVPEEGEIKPWERAPMELAVSGSLEITAISVNAGGVVLVTGWFSGTLFWSDDKTGIQGEERGFVMMTTNGYPATSRLLLCEPGLIPRRAWPARAGFQVLAEDFRREAPCLLFLASGGTMLQSRPQQDDRTRYVTQPEDLPEGTGG